MILEKAAESIGLRRKQCTPKKLAARARRRTGRDGPGWQDSKQRRHPAQPNGASAARGHPSMERAQLVVVHYRTSVVREEARLSGRAGCGALG